MFAIVTIAGQQFKVEEGQELFVHQLDASAGDGVSFDQVQLIEKNGAVQIGKPFVGNAKVSATVIGHQKGDKVVVFKRKDARDTGLKTVTVSLSPKSKLTASLVKPTKK